MIKLFFSIFLFTTVVNAQHFDWAKSIGGITDDNVEDLTVDNFGNVYIIGSFSDSLDFDPGVGVYNLTSNGNKDIFILKLSENGDFMWAKSFGGILPDGIYSIATDSYGNVYTTGQFYGTVDFDPGINAYNLTASAHDIFILKLSENGDFIWAKQIGGSSSDVGLAITIDDYGNVYTTGKFYGTVDFDPGINVYNITSSPYDIFILKVSENGDFMWAKSFGGNSSKIASSIVVDKYGNIYLKGRFSNTVDFDMGVGVYNLTSIALSDIFINKVDSIGNLIWAKQIGGYFVYDVNNSLVLDSAGNVYAIGNFENDIDFDPGVGVYNLTSNGQEDVFISKLDVNGDFIWAKSFGGGSKDVINSIELDGFGNIYTTGSFKNTVDFDPGIGVNNLSSVWAADAFISKLDSDGNFLWASSMGGGADDEGVSIEIDNNGSIYTVGTFDAGANFNPEGTYILQSNGAIDIFISKLSQCSNSIINTSPTLSALDTTASYQWLDCVNNYSFISGATSQSYTPTINGIYALEITTNYCVDTSACIVVNNVSIAENAANISLYPNPTDNGITLDIEGYNGSISVGVYDLQGRLLETTTNTIISMGEYAKGIYVFKVAYGDVVEELKVVKD
jgi:hypothetical protein